MANISEKEPEKIKESIGEKIEEKIAEELYEKKDEGIETRELPTEREKIIREELGRGTAKTKLDPELEEEVKKKARQIESLDEKGRLKHLLVFVQEKGVDFAVEVAKEMNDHYILDVFHDILAREGFYKKFQK